MTTAANAELRAAAELALAHIRELREAWRTGALSECDGKGGMRSNRNVDVEVALRDALEGLATVHDDDDDEVTEEWLRSIGFTRDDCGPVQYTISRHDALPIGLWAVADGWKAVLKFNQYGGATIVRGLRTRVQLRSLLTALSIPLPAAK